MTVVPSTFSEEIRSDVSRVFTSAMVHLQFIARGTATERQRCGAGSALERVNRRAALQLRARPCYGPSSLSARYLPRFLRNAGPELPNDAPVPCPDASRGAVLRLLRGPREMHRRRGAMPARGLRGQ